MASIPPRISGWICQNYPKPTVDPAWLEACLSWIAEESKFTDVHSQGDEIIKNVETQLLNSDLRDSMLEGTGFPQDITSTGNTRLYGRILVQITSMTEIGHSAFTLQNVQQTRIDRADLTGLTPDGEDDDEGPIPKFPRSMLKFEISDGTHSLRAIEFRRLPELELGTTPLGYKVRHRQRNPAHSHSFVLQMIIKDVPIRRGVAFLEPSNVELKGYMTEELEVYRDAQFARDLRQRLGLVFCIHEICALTDHFSRPEPRDEPVASATINGTISQGTTLVGSTREPLRDLDLEDVQSHPTTSTHFQGPEYEAPTRRRVPGQRTSSTTSISHTVTINPVSRPSAASVRQPSGLSQEGNLEGNHSEFSDDTPLDDAFLHELDRAEQEALAGGEIHPGSTDLSHQFNNNTEVIVIDSDSDDKENIAPVMARRVRRRILPPENDVIVID